MADPSLRGKAVIVSGSGPRSVVTTATYEARAYGVYSGMPTSQARRLCPHAILVAPDFQAYRKASAQVWELVTDRLGELEQAGLDEAYADLTDAEHPVSLLRETVAAVKEATGLQLSVGFSENRLVAKMASDAEKPCGFVVLSREQACERFASLPVRAIPGIGPKTTDRLRTLGIHTISDLQGCSEALLRASLQ